MSFLFNELSHFTGFAEPCKQEPWIRPSNCGEAMPPCEFSCDSMEVLTEHSQSIHHPYSCNICFLCFSAEYNLLDHRWVEHEISSLGATVAMGEQGDQMLEPPQPENVGAAKLVEPAPEECDQDDQMLEPPQPENVGATTPMEPTPQEGKVKGSEV